MENKALTEPDIKRVADSLQSKLGSLPSVVSNKCCIYKVPTFISEGNTEFYRPLVMSIGPVYYKDKNLETMQETKWIYLDHFLKNPKNACPNLEHYINFVIEKEGEIRDSYEHQINISEDEFREMIVLDAVFLVYHFMCRCDIFIKPSMENKLQRLMPYLSKDLFLLENQLPFFVVKGIFYKAFGDAYKANTFINVILTNIWETSIPGVKAIKSVTIGKKIIDDSNIKHLVDLQRMCCCLSLSLPLRNESSKVDQTCHPGYTAKQLKDAGVKFVAGESENPLDITFTNGKLEISKLRIDDHTEAYLRSMIYYEQCHYSNDSYFIDYVYFLDNLINTVEDVQVLIEYKIFTNDLGSNKEVVNLFNNICKSVNFYEDNFKYSKVVSNLNLYASKRWNQWMAILRSKYFNHPWVILSVIAAFALFVLTLLQTTAAFIYK